MTTDNASEYGRLLAERDRLIADGADPAELEMPLRPRAPLPAPDERQAGLRLRAPAPVQHDDWCDGSGSSAGSACCRAAQVPAQEEPDHALHFDPDCEECVYLARPVAIPVPAQEERLDVERLNAAMWAVLKSQDRGSALFPEDSWAIAAEYRALLGEAT